MCVQPKGVHAVNSTYYKQLKGAPEPLVHGKGCLWALEISWCGRTLSQILTNERRMCYLHMDVKNQGVRFIYPWWISILSYNIQVIGKVCRVSTPLQDFRSLQPSTNLLCISWHSDPISQKQTSSPTGWHQKVLLNL